MPNPPLAIENLEFHAGGNRQRRWIDDFERVIGKPDYSSLTQRLQGPAYMNISEAERLSDLALAERQLNRLTAFDRKVAPNPDIKLEQQVRDALFGVPQTDVGEMVVRAPRRR